MKYLITEDEADEMEAAFYRAHVRFHPFADLSRGPFVIVMSCPECPQYPEGLWSSAEIDNKAREQALGRDAEPRQFPGLRIRERASA